MLLVLLKRRECHIRLVAANSGTRRRRVKTSQLGAFGGQDKFSEFGGELDGIDEDVQDMLTEMVVVMMSERLEKYGMERE